MNVRTVRNCRREMNWLGLRGGGGGEERGARDRGRDPRCRRLMVIEQSEGGLRSTA